MDGPTAAAEMRSMGYEGLIIGVTGNAMTRDIEHFVSRGATCVLAKPLDMNLFSIAVKQFATALD